MAESGDFPDDFAERVLANVVTNETNVRAVAQKVAWARWTPAWCTKRTRERRNTGMRFA